MYTRFFYIFFFFFFQAEDGIRDKLVTGVQTCALPISSYQLRAELVRRWLLKRPPTLLARLDSTRQLHLRQEPLGRARLPLADVRVGHPAEQPRPLFGEGPGLRRTTPLRTERRLRPARLARVGIR